jgi:hypothetical protein
VGEPVVEALRGRLQEVRDALEDVLERTEREVEGAAQTALGEGQGPTRQRLRRGRSEFAHGSGAHRERSSREARRLTCR